ncbi:hypothetical protein L3Q82_012843 [Scortum barcoo]|uniref:Uncharacterized protein n=1 Tax=Scortum barcoo TaxID=214431 RepID=A0ACB8W1M3_9TELE|nr:hypothetical protein L3Q82_012843 [Scortum barcoo]
MMKCFERLVKYHIISKLPPTFDPLQFAYRQNRSTEDAICSALHLSLTHLEEKNTHVRMLFLDFSSAFNTIIPQHLVGKLGLLGFSTPLCNWLLDFLTERPQSVRVGKNTSSVITLSTGSPQGFCRCHDTTVVGLIRDDNDLAYREEVEQLVRWCEGNNVILNVDKTKEITVDFRKIQPSHAPLLINNSAVEVVSSTKFLGVHITDDLTVVGELSASLVKRAQQRLHFLRRMKRAHLPPPILTTFYRSTVESILTSCISVWCGGSAADWRNVRRVVRTAEKIIGSSLPSVQDIASQRCVSRASNIIKDASHPHHRLFSLLPSWEKILQYPVQNHQCSAHLNNSRKERVQALSRSLVLDLALCIEMFTWRKIPLLQRTNMSSRTQRTQRTELKTVWTKELIVDFGKQQRRNYPPFSPRVLEERADSFRYLSPQTLEEILDIPSDTEELLLLHHREHPDREHHRLIREQNQTEPQGSTERVSKHNLSLLLDL